MLIDEDRVAVRINQRDVRGPCPLGVGRLGEREASGLKPGLKLTHILEAS